MPSKALKRALVPLAEEVNRVAVRGVRASDTTATRRTLLSVLENLARDEARALAAQRIKERQRVSTTGRRTE
jgi:hypothetical protein